MKRWKEKHKREKINPMVRKFPQRNDKNIKNQNAKRKI